MIDVLIGFSCCPLTRKAFRDQGINAWTCDLLPSRGSNNYHIQGDVWDAIRSRSWDFGIFHPMCTYLITSGAWAFKDPDFVRYPGKGYHQKPGPNTLTGKKRRVARAKAIEEFGRLLSLPFPVVVENPATNFVNKAIRPPDQIVHPYDFGDDASKATGLWRSADVPALVIDPFKRVDPRLVCDNGHTFRYGLHKCPQCKSQIYLPRWGNQTDSGQNKLGPSDDRWLERSATFPGIAAALGTQYGRWLIGSSSC